MTHAQCEQTLRSEHENNDYGQQREHFGHRATSKTPWWIVLEMVNADAMVPNKLEAPPNTTTKRYPLYKAGLKWGR